MKLPVITLLVALALCAQGQKIGYSVYITGTGKINKFEVKTIAEVESLVAIHYDKLAIAPVLKHSRYFQILDENKGVYVEQKLINKRGKYKRISNKKWRNI